MHPWIVRLSLPFCLLLTTIGCGGSSGTPTNIGLFGNWNVAMNPTNSPNAVYVFALAMSQEGSSTFSGSSIPYTGSVPIPSNMCIDPNSLRATATTGSNGQFTMTITDPTSNTIISASGSLNTQGTSTLSGTYNNPPSGSCSQSQGTFNMVPQ
jgi:hypothetical protein